MNKVIFLVRDLQPSELNEHLISQAKFYNAKPEWDVSFAVFDNSRPPVSFPHSGILTPFDCYGHNGLMVATCWRTADFLYRVYGRRLFYVWDLELGLAGDVERLRRPYRSLDVVTRNAAYARAVNGWGGKVIRTMAYPEVSAFASL